jgi:hypothetical protein
MKPTFCIVGAQKAGSTFLQAALGRHPEIYVVPRELPFFEDPDFSASRWNDFERNFDGARAQRVTGFKRPDYLAQPIVATRLARHLPDLRVVAVLRDPISRAVSAFYHYMRFGLLPVIDVNAGMAAVLSGELQTRYPAAERILRYSMYHEGLKNYFEVFPKAQVAVLLTEDIKLDPAATAAKLHRFLGVSAHDLRPTSSKAANEGIYHPVRIRWSRASMRLRYEALHSTARLNERRLGVTQGAAYAAMQIADSYVLKPLFSNDPPALSPEIRRALHERLDPDVRALEQLLSRDLSAWCNPRNP